MRFARKYAGKLIQRQMILISSRATRRGLRDDFSLDMLDRGCKELLVRQTCTQALFDRMVTSTVETKTEIVRGRF